MQAFSRFWIICVEEKVAYGYFFSLDSVVVALAKESSLKSIKSCS
jgi:hypothetical protein